MHTGTAVCRTARRMNRDDLLRQPLVCCFTNTETLLLTMQPVMVATLGNAECQTAVANRAVASRNTFTKYLELSTGRYATICSTFFRTVTCSVRFCT